MIVITGAAGFIASNLVRALNSTGERNLLLVDDFSAVHKNHNWQQLKYAQCMERDNFLDWFIEHAEQVKFVFHLGARTDTTEFNFRVLDSLNLSYSKALWEICTTNHIPLLYASSAATYGLGEHGFDDDEQKIPLLKPLNPYGLSKQLFDMFALTQKTAPPCWVGLKFFNVYGPHENHKGRMASVVLHAFRQIMQTGELKLFQSHNHQYADGGQQRDFIFVEDVVRVCLHFYQHRPHSGIYNCGTGQAHSFNELAEAIFAAMKLPQKITYISTPADIRDKYQYYTQATVSKLRTAGFGAAFTPLCDGVAQYISWLKINEYAQ